MDYGEIVWHIFAAIGGIKVLTWLLPWFYTKLFCCINLSNYAYGYALITGSSDGIGKALSKEFARRGFNLILVSRTLSKLESVKSEISSQYPSITIHIIACDFSFSHKDPISFYNDLFSKLQNFEISVLVNNVGVVDMHSLLTSKFDDVENLLSVNIYPMIHLTSKLMPMFIQRFKERKLKSLLINLSSIVEEPIAVGMPIYAATKRFAAFFGEGLKYECKGVEVVTAKPGAVDTGLAQKVGDALPMKVSADDYVKALLDGLRSGVNHGHWKHRFFGTLLGMWPYFVNVIGLRMLMPIVIKMGYFK